MKPDLIAKVEVPTTALDSSDKPRNSVGTAYPLRDGLVITARHVLYYDEVDKAGKRITINAEGRRILSWRKDDSELPYFQQEILPENILLESAEYDIALIEVQTPESTSAVIPCREAPAAKSDWGTLGYAKGGKLVDDQRTKIPAMGEFHMYADTYTRHLDSGELPKTDVWKGMSGSPIFKLNTHELTGVLTHGNPAFPNRLMMTSLSWLLQEKNWSDREKGAKFRYHLLGDTERLIAPVKKNSDFKQFLVDEICSELDMWNECNKNLCAQLAKHLRIRHDELSEEVIAEALVDQDTSSAIECLTVTTVVCNERFRKPELIEETKSTAQGVLGWLVLGSLNEEQLSVVAPHCIQHNSFFFTLAVKSLTGVEVVMARRFNRQSHLEHKSGSEQKSRFLIEINTDALKWDEESSWLMFSEVWNTLFPNEKMGNRDREKPRDWSRLNTELKKRRDRSFRAEHYYISFDARRYDVAELSSYVVDVYTLFLSKLDQMTIVQYGTVGNDDNFFLVTEDDLLGDINGFYLRINGEKG